MTTPQQLLTPDDVHLFNEGTHRRLYRHLGAHPVGRATSFAVWAPGATSVEVVGDVGDWWQGHRLAHLGSSGLWIGVIEGFEVGHRYKFRIHTPDGRTLEKSDPFAAQTELAPATASVIADLSYDWHDGDWMNGGRAGRLSRTAPISIYEVHLGSWGRTIAHEGRFPTYEELAGPLADHALAHGFTHVELLPIMEHPFYGSWGYQTTGYFAPTARHGHPTGLMHLIDHLHQRGIGVILDWVPSHFPIDAHGLAGFDGSHLFEHADPRQGWQPDWGSAIFNYGRHEVRGFLISSAMSWFDRYHIDGLRVDAVASMLYLDYSRNPGEWIPNEHGGRENLQAVRFLRELNEAVFAEYPDTTTIAEESTAWPMVTQPTYVGGLGFGFKWDMGWMNDTLRYFQRDPVHRSWHHHELTFRSIYAFSENYVMPLSHDEVVHGKGSLVGKMPGDRWQQLANLRLLYAWQWGQPGKKLLFMGGELAQASEWAHEATLEWWRHDEGDSAGVRHWLADLGRLYRDEPAMHVGDCTPDGFQWIDADDVQASVYSFIRSAPGERPVVVIVNATPTVHHNYRLGVPVAGEWVERLNSDAGVYGGSGVGNLGRIETTPIGSHGHFQSLNLTLPPLGALFLQPA